MAVRDFATREGVAKPKGRNKKGNPLGLLRHRPPGWLSPKDWEGIPMPRIIFKLRFSVKQRLLKLVRKCREAACRIKILLLISVSNGRTPQQAADTFRVHRATVYRLLKRFQRQGEDALVDRR